LQNDGTVGYTIGRDGTRIKQPYITNIRTPVRFDNTILPGVVTVSASVTYLGKLGDILQIYILWKGKEVPGTRHQRQIKESDVGPNGNGAAVVNTFFNVP
jgi:hypothetical protein